MSIQYPNVNGQCSVKEENFLARKVASATTSVLEFSYANCQLVVTTDESDVVVSAVLEQDLWNRLQPIAFAIKNMQQAEDRYSVY